MRVVEITTELPVLVSKATLDGASLVEAVSVVTAALVDVLLLVDRVDDDAMVEALEDGRMPGNENAVLIGSADAVTAVVDMAMGSGLFFDNDGRMTDWVDTCDESVASEVLPPEMAVPMLFVDIEVPTVLCRANSVSDDTEVEALGVLAVTPRVIVVPADVTAGVLS